MKKLFVSLLVIAGALLFTTSCGPKKYKIDDSTVLPFKDKAELDSLLNFPLLPDYTIEEYYTMTDMVDGDERFVVCCKFLEEVPPAKVQEILAQVDSLDYNGWHTFDLGKKNNMRLFFNIDTTLAADRKRPDILGDKIHIDIEILSREQDSWKGFEVVFRNDRADYSIVYDRDTLSKMLGVDIPPLTERSRIDEMIFYDFDTIPSEEFYQALATAPHWRVSPYENITMYFYDYDDGDVWTTADLVKGDTNFTFERRKSIGIGEGASTLDYLKKRISSLLNKKSKKESN